MSKTYKVLVLGVVAVWAAVFALPDDKLHVVFCNVGQGDAVLVYRGTAQMLVDGGRDRRVLECLARHMPFYDRRIEIVVATHPEEDHIGGLIPVLQRYSVQYFVSTPLGKDSEVGRTLAQLVGELGSDVASVFAGDRLKWGGVEAEIIWPGREWMASRVEERENVRVGMGSAVLGVKVEGMEANDFSVGMVVKYGEFEVGLTGDADGEVMEEQVRSGGLRQVEVVKAPHHGSKFGAVPKWWEMVRPELAVVSVGKNNYGHPSGEVIGVLEKLGVRVLRTDVDGEVEVVSDGKRWWFKKGSK